MYVYTMYVCLRTCGHIQKFKRMDIRKYTYISNLHTHAQACQNSCSSASWHDGPLTVLTPRRWIYWMQAQQRHEGSPEQRWLKLNAHMATVDRGRQGQAAHTWYKSRTVVEFASGKAHACMIDTHLSARDWAHNSVWSLVQACVYSLSSFIDRRNGCTKFCLPRSWNNRQWQILLLSMTLNQQCIAHSGLPPRWQIIRLHAVTIMLCLCRMTRSWPWTPLDKVPIMCLQRCDYLDSLGDLDSLTVHPV